jgi:hypothetical protein
MAVISVWFMAISSWGWERSGRSITTAQGSRCAAISKKQSAVDNSVLAAWHAAPDNRFHRPGCHVILPRQRPPEDTGFAGGPGCLSIADEGTRTTLAQCRILTFAADHAMT